MLILTRKINQAIVVDGTTRVVVYEVERDRAKIGFLAPDSIKILRQELLEQEDKETRLLRQEMPAKAAEGNEEKIKSLILTRKIDQAVRIGDDVGIMVLGIERDRVKIGISAPREKNIIREELLTEERYFEDRRRPGNKERF